jgi:hypothetical protein
MDRKWRAECMAPSVAGCAVVERFTLWTSEAASSYSPFQDYRRHGSNNVGSCNYGWCQRIKARIKGIPCGVSPSASECADASTWYLWFDHLKPYAIWRWLVSPKLITAGHMLHIFDLIPPPMPTHVTYGLRGFPSRLWPKCNRLLRLGRSWGAVT